MTPPKPKKENVCCTIVTYRPDFNLRDRMTHVQGQVEQVVVVDNNSSPLELGRLQQLSLEFGVHLISNSQNLGIGAALNQGVRWAAEQGCQWALTLDQDSVVADDIVETLSAVYEHFPEKEKLAIIGSNYRDSNSGRLLCRTDRDDGCSWQEVKTVITSGSLVSLQAYAAIGPFREEFFMDCVDLEYCLRSRSRGFKILLARKPLMQHAIGASTMHKLPWKMTGTSNHSTVRRYYMTRNHLALAREYLLREPMWVLSTLYSRLKSTVLMCLFEENRLRKLEYTAIGAFDGLFSNSSRNLS